MKERSREKEEWLQPSLRGERGARGGWRRRRTLECAGAKAVRSGIIYGATCKVRKITPASDGFRGDNAGLCHADPSARTPCGSAGQGADDVYEFFSRITYFARFPRRIISTACKDYLLYCPQSEILRINRMFIRNKNV